MTSTAPGTAALTIVRCAIYTRKSTEEGLDQEFNSLDAQREACTAFILSQKHEGYSRLSCGVGIRSAGVVRSDGRPSSPKPGMTETPTDCFMSPSRLRDIAAAPALWALRPRGSPAPYRVAADRRASD